MGDFLESDPTSPKFRNVRCIQVDPSCSGSGMSHTSLDFSPPSRKRLQSLTKFQLQCIEHAARFPSVTRISYSTCSVYEEEDEEVVAKALHVLGSPWELDAIYPSFSRRGHVVHGLTEQEAGCLVRCEVGDGMGQGFFVCVFKKKDGAGTGEERRKENKDISGEKRKQPQKKEKNVVDYVERGRKRKYSKRGKKVPLVCFVS